ncbi:DeoR/GlpR family DNA-binding transcription regulator [Granulosicoccus antarcticus]|uniref:Deoxyribose operon repressor n=1 Tax=Granulosicoccus antarcticus IMCC3135 TaxID=1192854 RepID=A0A2Z2NWI1_9GAMM|nr:DeoR/GlpR family DNA-binding transcription regulator [Granulosicoccus antarcticus]ASJ74411.1 Deoxyribose operon repressor [Granulosicoccus antarcticus IMCC3135]
MASRKQKRLSQLLDLISEQSSMHIRDAAEVLDVSEMTIRRDIRDNPDKFGHLGGHIVPANKLSHRASYDLGIETDIHDQEKRQACQQCLPFAITEDIIFVDCGTTLVHLMDLLPHDLEISIVCHALNIADRAVRKSNVNLILMGGQYHSPTSSFHGLGAEAMFQRLGISTGFFSAAGIHPLHGATCTHFNEVAVKQAAMNSTTRRILVADSSKIGKVSPARYASIEDFDLILTEQGSFEFASEAAD